MNPSGRSTTAPAPQPADECGFADLDRRDVQLRPGLSAGWWCTDMQHVPLSTENVVEADGGAIGRRSPTAAGSDNRMLARWPAGRRRSPARSGRSESRPALYYRSMVTPGSRVSARTDVVTQGRSDLLRSVMIRPTTPRAGSPP